LLAERRSVVIAVAVAVVTVTVNVAVSFAVAVAVADVHCTAASTLPLCMAVIFCTLSCM